MGQQEESKNDSNELIINHFILTISILFQSLVKVLNIVIPNPKNNNRKAITKNNANIQQIKDQSSLLHEKSSDELRQIIHDVDVISGLKKNQLTELILSSKEALELIEIEQRRNFLKKMTNQNIKDLLIGVEGISRLRKSELIEMVLKKEGLRKKILKKKKGSD